eukprot:8290188-Prorocentrum_lima.AAC.1
MGKLYYSDLRMQFGGNTVLTQHLKVKDDSELQDEQLADALEVLSRRPRQQSKILIWLEEAGCPNQKNT